MRWSVVLHDSREVARIVAGPLLLCMKHGCVGCIVPTRGNLGCVAAHRPLSFEAAIFFSRRPRFTTPYRTRLTVLFPMLEARHRCPPAVDLALVSYHRLMDGISCAISPEVALSMIRANAAKTARDSHHGFLPLRVSLISPASSSCTRLALGRCLVVGSQLYS